MFAKHKTLIVLLVVLLLSAALLIGRALDSSPPASEQAALREAGIVLLPKSRALPALTLTGTDGQPVALDRLRGQWTLMFFGYTFCPDICPTTLAELSQLRRLLPEALQGRYQVLMVSVDPHRDTPEQLGRYLGFYKAGYRGLTGELADIQTLAQAVSIPFVPGDTRRERYTVDHSGNLALIGPDGRQRGFLRAPLNVPALAAQLPALLGSD